MADRGQHVQRSEHAGIGSPEVTEVVVSGVFAAEDRIVLRHGGLDEGVTHSGDDHLAALGLHDLRHDSRSDLVTDDGRTWLPDQLMSGDHCRHDGRVNYRAALVDDETTICVAVEDQGKISRPVS